MAKDSPTPEPRDPFVGLDAGAAIPAPGAPTQHPGVPPGSPPVPAGVGATALATPPGPAVRPPGGPFATPLPTATATGGPPVSFADPRVQAPPGEPFIPRAAVRLPNQSRSSENGPPDGCIRFFASPGSRMRMKLLSIRAESPQAFVPGYGVIPGQRAYSIRFTAVDSKTGFYDASPMEAEAIRQTTEYASGQVSEESPLARASVNAIEVHLANVRRELLKGQQVTPQGGPRLVTGARNTATGRFQ